MTRRFWLFGIPLLLSAADPFSGTWELNVPKSKLPPPVARSQTAHIRVNGEEVEIHEIVINASGERLDVRLKARFDGNDYPVSGTPFADTVAYRRPDARTITGVVKKDGRVVLTERAVVSEDGKTVTATFKSPDPGGSEIGVAVFEKQ